MPDPVTGIMAGTSLVGGAISSGAASSAGRAQEAAAQASVAEQRAARDQMVQLLQPYTSAGVPALRGLMDIAGIGGQAGSAGQPDYAAYVQANPDVAAEAQRLGRDPVEYAQWHYQNYGQGEGRQLPTTGATAGMSAQDAQAAAISAQEQSPFFQSLARQGESAILQNASATGGLRGGNTQGALAQFRPNLLNQFIEQQYQRLSGIATTGQNSAAQTGTAGMTAATNISAALTQGGEAQAKAALGTGAAWNQAIGGIGGALSKAKW